MTSRVYPAATRADSEPIRFAYADPPYVGLAKRHYGDHPDFAGEVDHGALIERMTTDFDGWALSASMRSLRFVLPLCPENVLVLAWHNTNAPPMGDHRMYSWEPVILYGGRRPAGYEKTSFVGPPPMWTFRPVEEGHVIGEKSEKFCHWVFRCAGLCPQDELVDLFPGSGAVGRAWSSFTYQGVLI